MCYNYSLTLQYIGKNHSVGLVLTIKVLTQAFSTSLIEVPLLLSALEAPLIGGRLSKRSVTIGWRGASKIFLALQTLQMAGNGTSRVF